MNHREALLNLIKIKAAKTGSKAHKENAAEVIRRRLDPSYVVSDDDQRPRR